MKTYQVAVVGGGFSGLGMAVELLRHGMTDFIVLEKAAQLGGTWRENTYPGCACDVPTLLYSFSFAPKPDWSRFFAEQPEIQAYLLEVARDFGVLPYVRTCSEVLEARFDEERRLWVLRTQQDSLAARFLVAGQGPLHEPRIPELPGLDAFAGEVFHSARWNHALPLQGRRVAVVGTGSSAIQFIPKIQPEVAELMVFQRTPSWVLPKPDHAVSPGQAAVYRRLPGLQRVLRGAVYGLTELLQRAQASNDAMLQVQKLAEWQLQRQVQDEALRRQLTPSFTLGCKRMLLSNTYYPALTASNVQLVPHGVERITATGVVSADGEEHMADTLIFATGFRVTDASLPGRIVGREARSLDAVWKGSPHAYLGTTVAGFPNLFLMLGPNLGNGHGSALTIIEAQTRYVVSAIRETTARGAETLEVLAGVQQGWNEQLDDALAGSVWNAGGCKSWYIDARGRNSTIYPWSTIDLRRRLRSFDPLPFQFAPAAANPRRPATPIDLRHAVVAVTGGARGIGRATAEHLLAAGAKVALGDLDFEAAQQAAHDLGPRARAYPLDVSQRSSFARFVAAVRTDLGEIDVLVNNAGVLPTGCFLEMSDARRQAVMAVNYGGTALGMRLVLPRMVQRGRGHVVNVASLAGKLAVPYLASYTASKHAVVGLSAAVRLELDGTGVSLSTVLPTAVKTRMATGLILEGLAVQEPADVARAVVASIQSRAPELTVPPWAGPLVPLYGLLPRRLLGWFSRRLRADRTIAPQVRAARAAFEQETVG